MRKLYFLALCFSLPLLVFSLHAAGQWLARYNHAPINGDDKGRLVCTDNSGNVYIAGASQQRKSGAVDYVTVKYNSSGQQQWVARYNGPGNSDDIPAAIVVDNAGNVIVTGRSKGSNSSFDYATVKYDGAGQQVWVARHNGSANEADWGKDVAVDATGNVFVTGHTDAVESVIGGFNGNSITTLKYTNAGALAWVAVENAVTDTWDGAAVSREDGNSLALDGLGSIYVTGSRGGSNMVAIKYNDLGTSYSHEWAVTAAGHNGRQVLVDGEKNVLVSTYSVLRKYAPTNELLWETSYSFTHRDMALDAVGNVYVTGYSGPSAEWDFNTAKFAASSGLQEWLSLYNGTGNNSDDAKSIAVDAGGNVHVTGATTRVEGRKSITSYATVTYNNSGVLQVPARLYDGEKLGNAAWAVTVDANGNIFVTGESLTKANGYDIVTLKYPAITVSPSITNTEAGPIILNAGSLEVNNYPNPFSHSTTIEFQLSESGKVSLKVYDLQGRQVANLLDQEKGSGVHRVNFDAGKLASGTYIYRFQFGNKIETRRLLLVR